MGLMAFHPNICFPCEHCSTFPLPLLPQLYHLADQCLNFGYQSSRRVQPL